jgi:hypothetical protein
MKLFILISKGSLHFFLLSFLVLILFLVVAYHDLCLVSICHWIHLGL